MKPIAATLAFLMLATAAHAKEWAVYSNPRFGETIDIPPGFVNDVPAPENGDGLSFHSADGKAELLVWGGNLVDGDFKADGKSRLKSAIDDGWKISFHTGFVNQKHAFSGSKGDRIMYLRSIASCKGKQALHFRIEYPQQQKKVYDAVVARLAKSLKLKTASDCG
jgi:hypothetical protein